MFDVLCQRKVTVFVPSAIAAGRRLILQGPIANIYKVSLQGSRVNRSFYLQSELRFLTDYFFLENLTILELLNAL